MMVIQETRVNYIWYLRFYH